MLTIIDAAPGSGKTSFIHQEMHSLRKLNPHQRWIYIAPLLSELTRLKEQVSGMGFEEPSDKAQHRTKFLSLLGLCQDKANIASTHALFVNFNDDLFEVVKDGQYNLVIDETLPVVEKYGKCTKPDFQMLIATGKVFIGDNNLVRWNHVDWPKTKYQGKHMDVMRDCDAGTLVCIKGNLLIWQFPVKFLGAFHNVYILTYLFEGSLMANYLKANKRDYHLMTVQSEGQPHPGARFSLSPFDQLDNRSYKAKLRGLIRICDDPQLNAIGAMPATNEKGKRRTQPLSKNWFKLNEQPKGLMGKTGLSDLADNFAYWFRYKAPARSEETMWTTFKTHSKHLKGKGYARGFVSHNAKATNEYKDCRSLAYGLNRFLDPDVSGYFREMGLEAREGLYALSELVQWVFRSRIREGKPIDLYIPSERMRRIFEAWLNHSDREIIYSTLIDNNEEPLRKAA